MAARGRSGTAAEERDGTPAEGLRVVVTGATGNLGTGVVRRLVEDPRVASVVGVARRLPGWSPPKTTWVEADVADPATWRGPLADALAGADAVIHLAWLFHPSRHPTVTWRTNVQGTVRLLRAVTDARVPVLLHASSVAAYSPGPKHRLVDESWPTHGWPASTYCAQKAYVERLLDAFAGEHPECRVVRMRPGLVLARRTGPQQRRIFAGPFVPSRAWGPVRLPFTPDLPRLRFQVVHTEDVADAFAAALHLPVDGAFNLAADPPVDPALLAEALGNRPVPVPQELVRMAARAAWRLRVIPAPGQMFDAVLAFPLMDTRRAREVLGWRPRRTARETAAEFLDGLRYGPGMDTPPLRRRVPGGGRLREIASGIGGGS